MCITYWLVCKLFDTLVRPMLCFDSDIWFIVDYIHSYRTILRAQINTNKCDNLGLQNTLHTKYCKAVLGPNKSACNILSLWELGRVPFFFLLSKLAIVYFLRLNSHNMILLIKESYDINMSLHENGFYSWYTLGLFIFKENILNNNDDKIY